jgi:starvation-inducible DNA-binding protein
MTSIMNPQSLPGEALKASRRAAIISGLNANLANLIDVAAAAKQAHWNVRGPNFQGLHTLFDTIAEEARAYSDLCAERAATLGGTAHGTIQDVHEGTALTPFPTDVQAWETLVRAFRERIHRTTEQIRGELKDLEDDLATQDMYIQIVRGLEMRGWMLGAHLT